MDVRGDLARTVHGLAGQSRGDDGAAVDPGPPARLAAGAAVDRQRLHAHVRGTAAHRRYAGRAVRPAPALRGGPPLAPPPARRPPPPARPPVTPDPPRPTGGTPLP